MVYQPSKRRALKPVAILVSLFVGVLVAVITWGILMDKTEHPDTNSETEILEEISEVPDATESKITEVIDVQPTLDAWLKTLPSGADVSAMIYDLDNEKVVAEYQADTVFYTESLYKLFVVYEGYRQVETGELSATATVASGYDVAECLDLAIRESNSTCAEGLLKMIGRTNLQTIMETDFGLENSSVAGLTSTAEDITTMLEIYYEHEDLSEATWATIQDSMLNQPAVDNGLCGGPCDWRQGLPSGFATAKVYNKVGWLGNGTRWVHYNDAAIVEFSELGRHYVVVLMTENTDSKYLAQFGEEFEALILAE